MPHLAALCFEAVMRLLLPCDVVTALSIVISYSKDALMNYGLVAPFVLCNVPFGGEGEAGRCA